MALVAVAALCMGVPACGRSVSSTQGQGSGIVSPTKGLVATTPAGTKPVQSVTWAVYRDVNSLDPIFAFDYPENTADSLMCESLLLQAPGGALGLARPRVTPPRPRWCSRCGRARSGTVTVRPPTWCTAWTGTPTPSLRFRPCSAG
jgi:peptide/nickel transport system substrate-binding protein